MGNGLKTNIAVLGTIGVGKSTLIKKLEDELSKTYTVEVKSEPSVSVPFLNEVLKRFYDDNDAWAYPLQLTISAINEIQMQELREKYYEVSLFDMPFSSFIYNSINVKNHRMTQSEMLAIDNISRQFVFHYVILIQEEKDTTIRRIMKRNKLVKEEALELKQDDVSIDDFDYLDQHIRDFQQYREDYIDKHFPDAEVIRLEGLPDIDDPEYEKLIKTLALSVTRKRR